MTIKNNINNIRDKKNFNKNNKRKKRKNLHDPLPLPQTKVFKSMKTKSLIMLLKCKVLAIKFVIFATNFQKDLTATLSIYIIGKIVQC